jgi:hypothetical protein
MRIHDVQPGYGGLIILLDRRGERLPLEVGVPFLAEVLEQEGQRVLLSLAGRLLRCKTALPLKPGSVVWLAVKEASPRRVALALVDPAVVPTRSPEETPEAVRSVAALLPEEPRLAETLTALAKLLPDAVQSGALPVDALPPGFLARLQATLAAVFFPPSAPADAAALTRQAALLAEVVHRLGVEPPASTPVTPWPPAVALAEESLKGLLLLLRRVLALPPASVAGEPAPTPVPPPSDRATVTLERLARAVEEILPNLTGQRLLAPSQTGRGQERLELYLPIPVSVGEQRHTVEIRLYREGGGRAKARPARPLALRISCRLSTANLGPVRVDLALRPQGTSEAHLYLSAEPVLTLFRTHEPELRDVLGTAGLHLGRVSYSLLPATPPDGGGRTPGEASLRQNAIDLRM